MSLILEALKQADTERARSHAPGVFSQPFPDAAAPVPTHRLRLLPWLLLAAGIVVLLGFTWPHLTRVLPTQPATPTAALAPAATTAPTTAPTTVQPPVAPPTQPPSGPLFRTERPSVAPPASPAPSPPSANPVEPAHQSVGPVASASASAPVGALPVPSADQLPVDVRRQLPSIQITGHTYSDNPTLRMLMVDGHMVVEGQAIAPGLRLERIGPHQAIFNHRGTRFSVGY